MGKGNMDGEGLKGSRKPIKCNGVQHMEAEWCMGAAMHWNADQWNAWACKQDQPIAEGDVDVAFGDPDERCWKP